MRERGSLVRRVRELHPMVLDGLLAALLTLIGVSQLLFENPMLARIGLEFRNPDALAVLLTLGQAAPLVWRRRAPRTVLAITLLAASVHLALGYQPTWAQAGMLVALYTVAAHRPKRQSVVSGLLFAVGLVAYGVLADRMYPATTVEESVQGWVFSFLEFATAWFLGDLQKRRLAYTNKLEAVNAQLAGEQELRARWAVAEERSRIARELHDVVAHSVSVMVVQAGAARRSIAGNPDQAANALTQIEATGRQALAEMRRLLGLLRDRRGGNEALSPQPSLAHLDSLVLAAREAGLPVDLSIEGEPRPLPAGIDLSAYRIVQEALTNSLKHAGPARATVRVCYGSQALEVQVWDDGRGGVRPEGWSGEPRRGAPVDREGSGGNGRVDGRGAADGDGHGLIGMRERVALFGGALEVGPRSGGGFRVAARLPLEGGEAR